MLMRHEGCGCCAGTESGGSGTLNGQAGCGELDDKRNIEV